MAAQADVRRIALSMPETDEGSDRFGFSVRHKGKSKGFAWVWMERVDPKKPRVAKPHYNGFPAVLVRLKEVTVADLKVLLAEAWRCQAPAALVKPKAQSRKSSK